MYGKLLPLLTCPTFPFKTLFLANIEKRIPYIDNSFLYSAVYLIQTPGDLPNLF